MVKAREDQIGPITVLDEDGDGYVTATGALVSSVSGMVYDERGASPGNNSIWIEDTSPTLAKFTDSDGVDFTLNGSINTLTESTVNVIEVNQSLGSADISSPNIKFRNKEDLEWVILDNGSWSSSFSFENVSKFFTSGSGVGPLTASVFDISGFGTGRLVSVQGGSGFVEGDTLTIVEIDGTPALTNSELVYRKVSASSELGILSSDNSQDEDLVSDSSTIISGSTYEKFRISSGGEFNGVSAGVAPVTGFTTSGSGIGPLNAIGSVNDDGYFVVKRITGGSGFLPSDTVTITEIDSISSISDASADIVALSNSVLIGGAGRSLKLSAGSILIGDSDTASSATNSFNSIVIGSQAGVNTILNSSEVFIGSQSGANSSVLNGIALGLQSMAGPNTTGVGHIAIGSQAMGGPDISGLNNIAIGSQAMGGGRISGNNNIAIGSQSFGGGGGQSGSENILINPGVTNLPDPTNGGIDIGGIFHAISGGVFGSNNEFVGLGIESGNFSGTSTDPFVIVAPSLSNIENERAALSLRVNYSNIGSNVDIYHGKRANPSQPGVIDSSSTSVSGSFAIPDGSYIVSESDFTTSGSGVGPIIAEVFSNSVSFISGGYGFLASDTVTINSINGVSGAPSYEGTVSAVETSSITASSGSIYLSSTGKLWINDSINGTDSDWTSVGPLTSVKPRVATVVDSEIDFPNFQIGDAFNLGDLQDGVAIGINSLGTGVNDPNPDPLIGSVVIGNKAISGTQFPVGFSVAVGEQAGPQNGGLGPGFVALGAWSTLIGYQSGQGISTAGTGFGQTYLGANTGPQNAGTLIGDNNIAIGRDTFTDANGSSANTIGIGYNTLKAFGIGPNNIGIGQDILSGATILGNNAITNLSVLSGGSVANPDGTYLVTDSDYTSSSFGGVKAEFFVTVTGGVVTGTSISFPDLGAGYAVSDTFTINQINGLSVTTPPQVSVSSVQQSNNDNIMIGNRTASNIGTSGGSPMVMTDNILIGRDVAANSQDVIGLMIGYTIIGNGAAENATSLNGGPCVIIGDLAAQNAGISGVTNFNAIIGFQAAQDAVSMDSCVIMGSGAARVSTGISYDTILGHGAGNQAQGERSVSVGWLSGTNIGSRSVIVGAEAGQSGANDDSVLIGYQAGTNITTGSSNTIIGSGGSSISGASSNNIVIGNTPTVSVPGSSINDYVNIGGLIKGSMSAGANNAVAAIGGSASYDPAGQSETLIVFGDGYVDGDLSVTDDFSSSNFSANASEVFARGVSGERIQVVSSQEVSGSVSGSGGTLSITLPTVNDGDTVTYNVKVKTHTSTGNVRDFYRGIVIVHRDDSGAGITIHTESQIINFADSDYTVAASISTNDIVITFTNNTITATTNTVITSSIELEDNA